MKYTLSNAHGLRCTVTDFGCRIMDLWVPDRNGNEADVVLGTYDEDKYRNYGTGERFLGATIGRFGNRIAKGRFSIDGKGYALAINNGENALHGGVLGFDMVVWNVESVSADSILFSYVSADGEEGYPGTLKVKMSYALTDNDELVIEYRAITDAPTIVNLTHHSFFNLHGEGNGTVNDHVLTIHADRYTPVDETLIPTGELAPVEGTPFDFRTPTVIGSRLEADDEQLRRGGGYDHNWVLNKAEAGALGKAAEVYDPESGRRMEVFTTEPGMQFYGGNYFDGSMVGKNGLPYIKNCSIALETQHFPDSPNHPEFPSTVLRPNEEYHQICIYKFSVL